MKRIGVSGHRPNRLGGYDWDNQYNKAIRSYFRDVLTELLEQSVDEKYTVISGMALGFDQFIADVVVQLKEKYKGRLFLEAAIPFYNQHTVWQEHDVSRYQYLLDNVDSLFYVDSLPSYEIEEVPQREYHVKKLFKRNEYIVDTMDFGLALYNGSSEGGTASFIKYAEKKAKQVIVVSTNSI